jgi:hypothetical protein
MDRDAVEVTMVSWPADRTRRDALARAGRPRLLVVAADASPPSCPDPLEDWVREPVDSAEVDARVATLAARAGCVRPRLDEGRLRVDSRTVALSSTQAPVVRLLVAHFAQVVPIDEIRRAYVGAGGSDHPKAFRAMIARVKVRVAELDLRLANVRDRGYVLDAVPATDPRT